MEFNVPFQHKYGYIRDELWAGKPPQYFTKPPRKTRPPTHSGTGNEYQPKCGDALQLGVKGRYGSFHLWINVGGRQNCDPSLTRAIPECLEIGSS